MPGSDPRTSLLTWWLIFSQVGLSLTVITHWVTITNFIYIYIESQGLGFTLAREFICWAGYLFIDINIIWTYYRTKF